MRAVIITKPGGPDVLQIEERPIPKPGVGEVLLRVHAAGINRPDIAQRKGHYPAPPGVAADIPGLEVSGAVERVGEGVTSLRVGDQVCALVAGGGYAEYCTAPEGQCLPIPGKLSFIEAASLPEAYFTVWSNIFERGQLKKGESLLVQGGTSGIGVTAIQLAKAFGSTVYATAGTDEKCAYCKKLGASEAINYKTESFKDVIMSATNGRGVDVILDMIGGEYTQKHLDILATEGRLVLINFMKGNDVSIKLSSIMTKRLSITGSTLRSREVSFKSAIAAQLLKYVWPLVDEGKIKPVVHSKFSFEQASVAHSLMESSAHIGKIILVP